MPTEEAPINGCPAATQDIEVNIRYRGIAIDKANYGPMNPGLPNNDFWRKKAMLFNTTISQAKTALCANCAAFIQTPEMLDCIEMGLGDEAGNVSELVMQKANLGYCEIFDFKCAGARTCDAWVAGGPITKGKPDMEDE